MGQSATKAAFSDHITDAFRKDHAEVEEIYHYGSTGMGVKAKTSAHTYTEYGLSEEDMARRILKKDGQHKRVYYLRGTSYEMGFLMGRIEPYKVEALCTTYINHMAPQFISESFDMAMQSAPLFYQSVYEILLHLLTTTLIEGSVKAFNHSVEVGDIPDRYIEEMRGLVDGANSTEVISAVTKDRIIAANYGLDYIVMEIFSGRLLDHIKDIWKTLPPEVTREVKFDKSFLVAPDMCNAFMASGPATASGKDVFMMRDFQFSNAHVFHRTATIIIRDPIEPQYILHAGIAMPGMVGVVTGLNIAGLSNGVNLVRSSAVNPKRLGVGCMILTRKIIESAHTVPEAEQIIKGSYMGVPWIYYAVDASGTMKVFETIADEWDSVSKLKVSKWVNNKDVRTTMPTDAQLNVWRLPDFKKGVWPRGMTFPIKRANDELLRRWSVKPARLLKHAELTERQRWQPGGFVYNSWQDEQKGVQTVANFYFAPWKNVGPGILVVNNSFLNPILRLTQMNWLSTLTERVSIGNQWRYDTMVSLLKKGYGQLTFEMCQDIIMFLSPWKQPMYPQNSPMYDTLPDISQVITDLASHKKQDNKQHVPTSRKKNFEVGVLISGAITMIDVTRRSIKTKTGYWGSELYGINLNHYLFKPHVSPVTS